MIAKVRIGDIVEIKTSKGLAYAIYTHRHEKPPRYGAMLRVFDKLFQSRPNNSEEIVNLPVRFTTFFPLQAAVNQNLVEIVDNAIVPDQLLAFPIFRNGIVNPMTKKVETWWLWDGEKSWQVGDLTIEQRRLPIESVWNDTMLVGKIEEDWRPENDTR